MPLNAVKTKAVLAVRKQAYRLLTVRGAGAEVEKAVMCLARRVVGLCTGEQMDNIIGIGEQVFPAFLTYDYVKAALSRCVSVYDWARRASARAATSACASTTNFASE